MHWDDAVGPELRKDWERWKHKLKGVEDIHISRCIKPWMFGKTVETSLHHEKFWTDSQVVLAYIRSTTKRFKVFVAN